MPNGKPNILVIRGDDIGQANLSCHTHGLMGYRLDPRGVIPSRATGGD